MNTSVKGILSSSIQGLTLAFLLGITIIFSFSSSAASMDCRFREIEFNTYKSTDAKFDYAPGWSQSFCSGYNFAFQKDGNFVVYGVDSVALWSSQTANMGATRMVMQDDGNLVIYRNTTPLFSSNTAGKPGAFLRFQADGNAVIYNGAEGAVFSTPTGAAPLTFHGEKEDKQYCDTALYPHKDGKYVAATLFSNGKPTDGDHYLARLTVPTKSGAKGLVVQHSAGVQAAFQCPGSCERSVSSVSEGSIDVSDLDWNQQSYICTKNFDEWNDKQLIEFAVKIAATLF